MNKSRNKPRLGQNFLADPSAAARIVDALADPLGPISTRTVLEVGPGRGALTSLLADRSGRLVLVEYDPSLADALATRYRDAPHIQVLAQDILQVNFPAVLRATGEPASTPAPSPALAIGNLPYYITSPILHHFFRSHALFSTLVFLVQREVADRIAAAPGSSDYGLLSATAQLYAQVQTLFTLPPSAFSPPPEVHSTVLRLHLHPRFAELAVDAEPFLRFLKAAFQQKRKTLANNLRAAGYPAAALVSAFAQAAIPAAARAEALDLPAMARLHRALPPEP